MANIGSLAVQIVASTKGLTGGLASAAKSLAGFASQAASGFGTFGLAVEGVQKLGSIFDGLLGTPIKLAGELEQLMISFEVMLGSADKAGKLLEEIQKFAATTNFETGPLAAMSKQLLGVGFGEADIIPTLRVLGDVANGTGSSIEEMVFLLGQMKSQGRVMTQDMNQFAVRNVPIWREMAALMGVTEERVRELVEGGKIGFNEVAQVLNKMTSAGGQFFMMTEKQGQSLFGLVSTLRDEFMLTLTRIGQMAIEAFDLKGVVARLSEGMGAIRQNVGLLKPVFEAVGAVFRGIFDSAFAAATAAGGWFQPLADSFKNLDIEGIRAGTLDVLEAIGSGAVHLKNILLSLAADFLSKVVQPMLRGFETLMTAMARIAGKLAKWTGNDEFHQIRMDLVHLGGEVGFKTVLTIGEMADKLREMVAAGMGVQDVAEFFGRLRDRANEAATAAQQMEKAGGGIPLGAIKQAEDLRQPHLPQAMSKDSAEAVATINRHMGGQGGNRDIPDLLNRIANLEKAALEKANELVRRFNEAAVLRIVGGL